MASAASSLDGRSLLDFDDRDYTEPKPKLFADRVTAKGIETLKTTELTGDAFWLASEFKKLLQLKHLMPNWEASGAAPPNHTAIATAGRVLEKLAILDFRPDRIDPSTGEGVSLSFRRGNKSADLECFNTGEILALEAIDGGNPVIWEVFDAGIESAAARINRFIFG